MKTPNIFNETTLSLFRSYWQWRKLWLCSTLVFGVVGMIYAVVLKDDAWVASQGIIVRDEATGTMMRLGRFESQTQMRAAQETVLEMAHNPQVISAALQEVGRPSIYFGLVKNDAPPTPAEIDGFARNCVKVRAPRGAELGTTEVIYLDVKQSDRERAVKLTRAVCDALEKQLKAVRIERANGVISELEAALAVAETSLREANSDLARIETEVGSDLTDLRGLTDTNIGSTNRLMLDYVRDELRKSELSIRQLTAHCDLARAAVDNPDRILQAADLLLESQPSLRRLRDGLSEASIRKSTLLGKYTENNPLVVNASETEDQFRKQIQAELTLIVESLQASIGLAQRKMDALNEQERDLGLRLNKLADVRGSYSHIASEAKARSDYMHQVKRELTQAMAARDAAMASSLLNRVDEPVLGDKPVGPGRTTIISGATLGGLVLGLGLVFLFIPVEGLGGVHTGRAGNGPTSHGPIFSTGKSGSRASEPSRHNRGYTDGQPSIDRIEASKPINSGAQSKMAPPSVPAQALPEVSISVTKSNSLEAKHPTSPASSTDSSNRRSIDAGRREAAASPKRKATLTSSLPANPDASGTPSSMPEPVSASEETSTKPDKEVKSLGEVQSIIADALKCGR